MAVFAFDLDNFKQVNDHHGHLGGDSVLVQVAARLTGTTRTSDTVARIGGDEFVLLSPEIHSVGEAEEIAQRVFDGILKPYQINAAFVEVTFSMGIAMYPEAGMTPEALYASADRALYRAKRLGKNRYHFSEEAVPAG